VLFEKKLWQKALNLFREMASAEFSSDVRVAKINLNCSRLTFVKIGAAVINHLGVLKNPRQKLAVKSFANNIAGL
jgi:hypothetical protein